MAKPGIPQGTRDFTAETVQKRNYILNTIRNTFQLYGFEPLETPAMENLETLMGKYGEEGDKLIFKILNNGLNDAKNKSKASAGFEKLMEGKNSADLTERALKYDLTIPLARFVAMNHGQLTLPYKRYQIQPVWRADRPQKSRYREFTQCDADIVGSTSLLNEIDLTNIYHDVFTKLSVNNYELKINNRKLLVALTEQCGITDKLVDITTAIDKLDKTGLDKVKEDLLQKGITEENVIQIEIYLAIAGSNAEKLEQLKSFFGDNKMAKEGMDEISFIAKHAKNVNLFIDLTLARGLNYYTGTIFEVKAPDIINTGSIGGGGRYDNLTGLFGMAGLPGVGISFGVDRIYDMLDEMQLFPNDLEITTVALFFNMGREESMVALDLLKPLRSNGISCELFHEPVKIDKQFKYAEKKKIPFVIIIGSKEIESKTAVVKNLKTGQQETMPVENLPLFFSNK